MKKILYAIMIIGLITIGGCGKKAEDKKNTYQTIDCAKKDELLLEGAFLFDVREPNEYEEYHLENAINKPSTTILDSIDSEFVLDDPIIVYCKSGNRSATTAQGLVDLGFTNVYDLGSIKKCD